MTSWDTTSLVELKCGCLVVIQLRTDSFLWCRSTNVCSSTDSSLGYHLGVHASAAPSFRYHIGTWAVHHFVQTGCPPTIWSPCNLAPRQRYGNAYYHLNFSCITTKQPHFNPTRLVVSQEAVKEARQTHSDYLKTMLGVSLAIPTTTNN